MSDTIVLDTLHNDRQRQLYQAIDRLYGPRLGFVRAMRLAIELDETTTGEPDQGDMKAAARRLGFLP